ncbi:MAG: hypothetical protein ACI837_003134 [Crocinitomicaceae bacterium]|jgi:hypothetical protein
MTVKQVDLLNIGLILISAILAYQFPLELFILAFAILGPLHYLTEINWLDTKNYFVRGPRYTWLIIGLSASLILIVPKIYFTFAGSDPSTLTDVFLFINKWSNSVIFLTILLSIGFLYIRKMIGWIVLVTIGIIGAILLNSVETYTTIVGLLIPTIIHVYLFTLIFMLYGAAKSKSKYGYAAVIFALLIPVIFIYMKINPEQYAFSDLMKSTYLENNFHLTPALFAKFIGISDGKSFYFMETMELRLMMFMSFIYTYHYLNWFSKTTTIAWHKKLTLTRSIVIGVLWIGMLSLFYYDFKTGFLVALFFSFLHVILEFPLNMVSIRGIISREKN